MAQPFHSMAAGSLRPQRDLGLLRDGHGARGSLPAHRRSPSRDIPRLLRGHSANKQLYRPPLEDLSSFCIAAAVTRHALFIRHDHEVCIIVCISVPNEIRRLPKSASPATIIRALLGFVLKFVNGGTSQARPW